MPWGLELLKASYGFDERENQEEVSRRAELSGWGFSWPGLKEATGVCLPSRRVSGDINRAATMHQAGTGPVTSVISFRFLNP